MKKVFAVLICTAFLAATAIAETNVRLVASPATTISGTEDDAHYEVSGRVFLENCGTIEIIVPTRTRRIGPTSSSSSRNLEAYKYEFDFEIFNERRVIPSEAAFHPVKLAPGEQTELAPWKQRFRQGDATAGKVLILYVVEQDLASRFGWWSGDLRCEVPAPPKTKEPNP